MKWIHFCLTLLVVNYRATSYALVPVESLVLGSFSENYVESESDPLNSVFSREKEVNKTELEQFRNSLALYRGAILESKNLVNECKDLGKNTYQLDWEKIQVKRAEIALLQYIGLDLTTRSIAKYAKDLDFSESEYENLINNLMGNYCSQNVTVISLKELKNNLFLKFQKKSDFELPTVDNNPLFPQKMNDYVSKKLWKENQFKMSIKLFQSFCSWSGDPEDLKLLVPLVKNPFIMSFVHRNLASQTLSFDPIKNDINILNTKEGIKVWCENLICRKVDFEEFNRKKILSMGSSSFVIDLKKLYCNDYLTADYLKQDDPKIAKIIKNRTQDEENFLVSHFIGLITGVPDFLLGQKQFNSAQDLLRSSIDDTWLKWANKQTEDFSKELYFEEPLFIELVDRKLFFNKNNEEIAVLFDVNLGEFDRTTQVTGKIGIDFKVTLQNAFLRYLKYEIQYPDYSQKNKEEYLIKKIRENIFDQIEYSKNKLILPPWKGDLAQLVAYEIYQQVANKSARIEYGEVGLKSIPIKIYYAPFALKYLNNQFKANESRSK